MHNRMITPGQIKALHAIKRDLGWSDEIYHDVLSNFNVESSTELTFEKASDFIKRFGGRGKIIGKGKAAFSGSGRPDSHPAGHLTPDQALAIERLRESLGYTPEHLRHLVNFKLHLNCHPTMLSKASASKLIKILVNIKRNTRSKKS